MGQADSLWIAVAFQRLEPTDPIDNATAHRRPFVILTVLLLDCIFAMAIGNSNGNDRWVVSAKGIERLAADAASPGKDEAGAAAATAPIPN